eukprot:15029774-Alexandrium_andersonii.AAC.1
MRVTVPQALCTGRGPARNRMLQGGSASQRSWRRRTQELLVAGAQHDTILEHLGEGRENEVEEGLPEEGNRSLGAGAFRSGATE